MRCEIRVVIAVASVLFARGVLGQEAAVSSRRAPVRAVVSDVSHKQDVLRDAVEPEADAREVKPVLSEDYSKYVPDRAGIQAALVGADPHSHRACDFARAGNPQCVRLWAAPSERRAYWGYYVGGGAPVLGEGRCADEGTFGWDYFGVLYNRRVDLNWTHGRHQGGTGRYRTDGAKVGRD